MESCYGLRELIYWDVYIILKFVHILHFRPGKCSFCTLLGWMSNVKQHCTNYCRLLLFFNGPFFIDALCGRSSNRYIFPLLKNWNEPKLQSESRLYKSFTCEKNVTELSWTFIASFFKRKKKSIKQSELDVGSGDFHRSKILHLANREVKSKLCNCKEFKWRESVLATKDPFLIDLPRIFHTTVSV